MWWFYPDHTLARLDEQDTTGVVKVKHDYVWDKTGNPFVSQVTTSLDVDTSTPTVKRMEQSLDAYGNVTSINQYDYGLSGSATRTYNSLYLKTLSYDNVFIRNRLLNSSVTVGTGPPLTLVTNQYDEVPNGGNGGNGPPTNQIVLFDLSGHGPSASPAPLRGNRTTSVSFGNTTRLSYDYTGTVVAASDNTSSVSIQTAAAQQYSVPTTITANGYSTNLSWNGFIQLNSQTGVNGDVTSAMWDVGDRPTSTTSPYGATTTYTYTGATPTTNAYTTVTRFCPYNSVNRVWQEASKKASEPDKISLECFCPENLKGEELHGSQDQR